LLFGIIILFVAMGCVSTGTGTVIPSNGEDPTEPSPTIPSNFYAPFADEPGVPLDEGIYCGSIVKVPINFTVVGYNVPAQYFDITEDEYVAACQDADIRTPDVVCEACGWGCAVQSPYFYKFTRINDEYGEPLLTVHFWDLQCGDLGIEYRGPGDGVGEGIKVSATFEPEPFIS